MLSSPDPADMLTCPVGTPIPGRLYFETGYQRKFELSDLDKFYVAAGYRYKNFSTTIGLSQFGESDYYSEQALRAALSYTFSRFTASVIADGQYVSVGEGEDKVTLDAAAVGLAAGINYDKYHLGVVVDNINRPKLDENLVPDNTLYKIYAEVQGMSKLSITGHIVFEEHEEPMASFGQYLTLLDSHALFWGVGANPITYGGGLEISYRGYGLTYAVSYHPELGVTHNIALNIASGGLLD